MDRVAGAILNASLRDLRKYGLRISTVALFVIGIHHDHYFLSRPEVWLYNGVYNGTLRPNPCAIPIVSYPEVYLLQQLQMTSDAVNDALRTQHT